MARITARTPNVVKSEAKKRLFVTDGELETRWSMVMKSCAAWSWSTSRTTPSMEWTRLIGSTTDRTTSDLRVWIHSSSRPYCHTCCRKGTYAAAGVSVKKL